MDDGPSHGRARGRGAERLTFPCVPIRARQEYPGHLIFGCSEEMKVSSNWQYVDGAPHARAPTVVSHAW